MESMPSWIEVSLVVDGEMAEAVAEVLGRYVSGGVVIEATALRLEGAEEAVPAGPLRVCGYLPDDGELEAARDRIRRALWYLGRIHTPLPEPVFQRLQEADWVEQWKQHYHPIPIGRRLMILPAWFENPEPGRLAIKIEPGMAFGTGTHPTTQLAMSLLEEVLTSGGPDLRAEGPDQVTGALRDPDPVGDTPPMDPTAWAVAAVPAARSGLIDIGCGSGILSIAAFQLGAAPVTGVDIDPLAIEASRHNASLNGLADRIEWGQGSVAELLAGKFSQRRAPVVVVNILAGVILTLLDQGLARLVEPGGVLIASGILQSQSEAVAAGLTAQKLRIVKQVQREDWVALACEAGM